MLDQQRVDDWVGRFLDRLPQTFGERLIYVDHHGSWGRGEPRPGSDIDLFVVLDRIEEQDLEAYRNVVHSMPDARALASTFLGSVAELRAWPRHDLALCRHGRKVLHGTLDGLVEQPTADDLLEDVRIRASANLHLARHYLLHPYDLGKAAHNLRDPFKICFFAMQSSLLLTTGTYYARKDDMVTVLSDSDDREVVRIARDWHDLEKDRNERPMHYIRLLERWSRKMLARIANHE